MVVDEAISFLLGYYRQKFVDRTQPVVFENVAMQLPRSGHACWAQSQPGNRYLERMFFSDGRGNGHIICLSLLHMKK